MTTISWSITVESFTLPTPPPPKDTPTTPAGTVTITAVVLPQPAPIATIGVVGDYNGDFPNGLPGVIISGGGGSGAVGHAEWNLVGIVDPTVFDTGPTGLPAGMYPLDVGPIDRGTPVVGVITVDSGSVATDVTISDPGAGHYPTHPLGWPEVETVPSTFISIGISGSIMVVIDDPGTGFISIPHVTLVGGFPVAGPGVATVALANTIDHVEFYVDDVLIGSSDTPSNTPDAEHLPQYSFDWDATVGKHHLVSRVVYLDLTHKDSGPRIIVVV